MTDRKVTILLVYVVPWLGGVAVGIWVIKLLGVDPLATLPGILIGAFLGSAAMVALRKAIQ